MKKTLNFIPIILLGVSTPLLAEPETKQTAQAEKEMSSEKEEMASEKEEEEMEAKEEPKMSIIDTALANEDMSILVKAVKAAGLVEALSGEGPLTIFAPTNEAFEKLPEGTLEMLMEPENKEKLVAILKLHAVDGKVMSADLETTEVETLGGEVCRGSRLRRRGFRRTERK